MRSKWSSKFVYILAAIGAAAGLGNLWRFPMLVYQYGGSAFIFALLVSNIIIVLPLLMVEIIIGQRFQMTGPNVFEKIKKGFSWIQWIPIFTSFVVLIYYIPIMAWGFRYGISVFSGNFLKDPIHFFANNIIHQTPNIGVNGGLNIGLLISLIVIFIIIYFSFRKGLKSISNVLKYTVPIPFIFLIILGIYGIFLPGGKEGLSVLFVPDWSALLNIKLWQAAIGQSFFSASLAGGYFIFAGSHREKKSELVNSTIFILLGNFIVSLLSGIVIFSNLGYLANIKGINIFDTVSGGPDLIFSILPQAISLMPIFKIGFAFLLFVIVLTLGISSVFASVEVIVGSIGELINKKPLEKNIKLILIILFIIFFGTLFYITGSGSYRLDITDHFVGGYLFMLVGLLEILFINHFVGVEKIRLWINNNSKKIVLGKWFDYILKIIPIILGFIFILSVSQEFSTLYNNYNWRYIVIFGFIPILFIILCSILFGIITRKKNKKLNVLENIISKKI